MLPLVYLGPELPSFMELHNFNPSLPHPLPLLPRIMGEQTVELYSSKRED